MFGLGDYLDFTRTTYRFPMRASWGEDDKTHDEMDALVMRGLVEPFVWLIRKECPSALPVIRAGKVVEAGKLLGLIEGNHYYRFRDGTTSTQQICRLLGVRYLGLSAWVRLTVYRSLGKKKRGTGHNLNILLNHSVSSSGTLGASLAAANRKLDGWRGVDIFVTANDHQLGHESKQYLGCTQNGLPRQTEHHMIVGKAGSFQRGYQPGACATSYVEKKLLRPSQLGWLAFDAWVHFANLRKGTETTHTPEVWRFANFSV